MAGGLEPPSMGLIGRQIPRQSACKNCSVFWARFQRRWSGLLLPRGADSPPGGGLDSRGSRLV